MSQMTLEDAKKINPAAKYPPMENCKRCHGAGKFVPKHRGTRVDGKEMACICLFIDHEHVDDIAQMLGEFAKGELEKLRNGEYDVIIKQTADAIGKIVGRRLDDGQKSSGGDR